MSIFGDDSDGGGAHDKRGADDGRLRINEKYAARYMSTSAGRTWTEPRLATCNGSASDSSSSWESEDSGS